MAKAKPIVEGVWWVGCGSWGGLTPVLSDESSGNVFLIGGEGRYALIDAGTVEGVEAVLANVAEVCGSADAVKRIVLTHSHYDHVTGAAALKARTHAALAASDLAARGLGGDDQARQRLFIRTEQFIEVDEVLQDGQQVGLGPFEFRVLATPGHIPDAVTLVGEVAGRRIAFTGDTAIGDQGEVHGVVGWLDGHWGANPKHLLASLDRIAAFKPDLMLAGHGFPIEGADAVERSLQHCRQRVAQLLAIPGLRSMMPLDLSD